MANEDAVLNNIKKRWDVGERPDGSIIGTYKSAEYALFKNAINPLANGNVDLTVTRSLRNQLEIFPLGNSVFEIFSRDEKAVLIADKYGIDVYGITNQEEDKEVNEASNGVHDGLFDFVGL